MFAARLSTNENRSLPHQVQIRSVFDLVTKLGRLGCGVVSDVFNMKRAATANFINRDASTDHKQAASGDNNKFHIPTLCAWAMLRNNSHYKMTTMKGAPC